MASTTNFDQHLDEINGCIHSAIYTLEQKLHSSLTHITQVTMQHKISIDNHVQSIYQNHKKNSMTLPTKKSSFSEKPVNMNSTMLQLEFMISTQKSWKTSVMPLNKFNMKFTPSLTEVLHLNLKYPVDGMTLILPFWILFC